MNIIIQAIVVLSTSVLLSGCFGSNKPIPLKLNSKKQINQDELLDKMSKASKYFNKKSRTIDMKYDNYRYGQKSGTRDAYYYTMKYNITDNNITSEVDCEAKHGIRYVKTYYIYGLYRGIYKWKFYYTDCKYGIADGSSDFKDEVEKVDNAIRTYLKQ